jgi:hypothetical protein
MYCLVDPFTKKVLEFSSYYDDSKYVIKTEVVNGEYKVTQEKALCVEVEYDSDLLNKTYNAENNTFS